MAEQQAQIEIYTLDWCPYCEKAKAFLKSKGLTFKKYLIDGDEQLKEEMKKRANGAKTVPQIFIDDQSIGGYDDLMELYSSGKLNQMLGLEEQDYFNQLWEVVIVGGGPAALNAALYSARKGLEVLVLAQDLGESVKNPRYFNTEMNLQ